MKPIYIIAAIGTFAVLMLIAAVIINGGVHDWNWLSDVPVNN